MPYFSASQPTIWRLLYEETSLPALILILYYSLCQNRFKQSLAHS